MPAEHPAATVDPRVRKDGLCAGCGKPRRKHRVKARGPNKLQPNATSLARNIWLYELEKDPWCSSKCAREFHGAQLASDADDLTETRGSFGPQVGGPVQTGGGVRIHRFGWRVWVRVFGRWWGLCW